MYAEFYKPSMFNHYTEDFDSNSLILFNSYLGVYYLLRIPEEKKYKIINVLSQKNSLRFSCLLFSLAFRFILSTHFIFSANG